jgi:hypothetical protein
LIVDFEGDVFAFDADGVGAPLVVFGGGFFDVFDSVEAAGFAGVFVALGTDLAFVSFSDQAFAFVGGVEKDAGVGAGDEFEFAAELEVFEVMLLDIAGVEEMGEAAFADDASVFNGEGFGFFVGRPAVEGFAVEEGDEAFFLVCGFVGGGFVGGGFVGGQGEGDQGEEGEEGYEMAHELDPLWRIIGGLSTSGKSAYWPCALPRCGWRVALEVGRDLNGWVLQSRPNTEAMGHPAISSKILFCANN